MGEWDWLFDGALWLTVMDRGDGRTAVLVIIEIAFSATLHVHVQYTSKKSYHTFENNAVATLRPFIKQRWNNG